MSIRVLIQGMNGWKPFYVLGVESHLSKINFEGETPNR